MKRSGRRGRRAARRTDPRALSSRGRVRCARRLRARERDCARDRRRIDGRIVCRWTPGSRGADGSRFLRLPPTTASRSPAPRGHNSRYDGGRAGARARRGRGSREGRRETARGRRPGKALAALAEAADGRGRADLAIARTASPPGEELVARAVHARPRLRRGGARRARLPGAVRPEEESDVAVARPSQSRSEAAERVRAAVVRVYPSS